jgi:anti-anti-sigma factor
MEWSDASAEIRVAVEDAVVGRASSSADARSRDAAATIVHVAGELDYLTIPAFERALPERAALGARVVLDLSRVTFCSVVGIRALARLRERLDADGHALEIRRPHRAVRRVFELTGQARGWGIGPAGRDAAEGHGEAAALLTGALEAALCATGAPMGTAQYYDQDSGILHIVAHQGFDYRFVAFFETVEGRFTSCGAAAQDLRPVFVDDVAASPIFAGTPELEILLEASVGGVASLPIVSPARTLIGVVSTHQPAPGSWSADHRIALTNIGSHAAELARV